MDDPLSYHWSRSKTHGQNRDIVSVNTAQGDDGRHGLRPQVIGILGTGQRSSLTPLRPFIGHHPKTKKKTTIFSSLFCLSKRLVLCYSSQCTFYIVFLRSPHRCVVSLLPRRLHHSVYTPLFSGSSYRSVFVLLLTNFIRCDHFFIAALSINIF